MRITTRHRNEALQPRNECRGRRRVLPQGQRGPRRQRAQPQLHTLLCNCNCVRSKGGFSVEQLRQNTIIPGCGAMAFAQRERRPVAPESCALSCVSCVQCPARAGIKYQISLLTLYSLAASHAVESLGWGRGVSLTDSRQTRNTNTSNHQRDITNK